MTTESTDYLLTRWTGFMDAWAADAVYHSRHDNPAARDTCRARESIYRVCIEDLRFQIEKERRAQMATHLAAQNEAQPP